MDTIVRNSEDIPIEVTDLKLIRLSPSKECDSPVVCDSIMVTQDDQDSVPFVALSYVTHCPPSSWTATIHLNGADITISETLHDALRHQRRTDEDVYIWADPLCTAELEPGDPKDIIKENSNVYTTADEVIVYLGGRKETSEAEFAAVQTFKLAWGDGTDLNRACSYLGLLGSHSLLSQTFGLIQLLFRRPWWHWGRIGALLDLGIGSKSSFRLAGIQMDWDTFVCIVRLLRFAAPRLEDKHPAWLDQALLQIPGQIPEAFREVFSFDITGTIATGDTIAWGVGSLFSHPQDVLYSLSNTSEEHAAGRVFTHLSTRLCNRYRARSEEKLRRDTARPGDRPISQSSSSHSDADVALGSWLNLLMQRAIQENDEETLGVLRYSLSLVLSPGNNLSALPLQKDTNALYSYKPLRPGTKDIRILVLYPDRDPEAEIRCDLFPLDHDFMQENGIESFPYMALSYTWGNPNPPRFISLGGKQKQVTLSLYGALIEFRDPIMPSLLWVDALCINQDSIDEKNHQVNMMDEVYRNAGCVLIRLDEEPGSVPRGPGDYVLSAMNVLSSFERYLFSQPRYTPGHFSLEQQPEIQRLRGAAGGWQFAYSLGKVFHQDYWTRVWTMQEALLGRNALICNGGYTVYFKTLILMYKLYGGSLPYAGFDTQEEDANNAGTRQFLEIYGDILSGKFPSLFRALLMSRERRATVKHDHIYGVLGIVDRSGIGNPLTVDYRSHLFAVSRDVFWRIHVSEGSLDVLSACELRHHYAKDPALLLQDQSAWPSWLPDWSIPPLDAQAGRSILFAPSLTYNLFQAAADTKPCLHMLEDDRLLLVQGVIVDLIEDVDDEPWQLNFRSRAKAWALFIKKAKSQNIYGSGLRRLKAFKGTISLGQPIIDVNPFEPENLGDEIDGESNTGANPGLDEETSEEKFFDPHVKDGKRELMKYENNKKCLEYPGRFFVAQSGYIGRGPLSARRGDIVVIFLGAKVPTVLRELDDTGYFQLLGECYVHGIMQGGFMTRSEIKVQEFTLR